MSHKQNNQSDSTKHVIRFCKNCGYDKDGLNSLGTIIIHHGKCLKNE
jgi:hypothetical protein